MTSVEDLSLHLVGCDEDLLQGRVIQQLRWNKVYRTLSQPLITQSPLRVDQPPETRT